MSDDHSARLGLPYLAAGQMQKHVTLNEALTRLDALVQTAVVSCTTAEQPAGPEDGALWILPSGATGADWSLRPGGALMRAEGGGWTVVEANDGLVALVLDDGELVVRHGGDWVPLGTRLGAVQTLVRLGVGTTADAGNPFAARLNAALWTALEAAAGGTGDLRLTLNKEASGDVLSLLFQSGWGGRAELGLVGNDDLRLKVSADGADWREAFAVDRATGRTTFALGAGRRAVTIFTASGSYAVPAWARSVEAVLVGGGGGGGAGAFGASGPRHGGGGGGAGGISRGAWAADLLGEALDVVVGVGGGAGSDGSDSVLSTGGTPLLTGRGGGSGGPGDSTGGAAGSAGAGAPVSNAGGASGVTAAGEAGRSLDRPDAPGGGGAGGGLDGAGVAQAGGAGGDGGSLAVMAAGGAGGTDADGAPGNAAPQPGLHWAGGGGGGGGAAASGAGHTGAAGGSAGGGGGGGGAGVSAGGAGGAGGPGVVCLVAVG